jgi:hypothetical protein
MPKKFPDWQLDTLPDPPPPIRRQWTRLIGPGMLMVGANIGGGEWLFGPLVTAQYGGQVLWMATLAILVQSAYNLSVMKYTMWCGESIFVGFFRMPPGLPFWPIVFLTFEFSAIWPYLSANAAVPLASVVLGRLPTSADTDLVKALGYGVFLTAFVPLIFGGKIYNALEKVMVTKLAIVLGYLGFVTVFFVSWDTWKEIFTGFFQFGKVPEGDVNWARLAAFTAIAGAGGLTNSTFSGYARDKGWAMGAKAGAIASAVGGRAIQLSHTGKVFELSADNLAKWRQWLKVIHRDQFALWIPGCILGMALPAMFSYEFIRGATNIDGNAVAAMTAEAIAARHGQIFWFLTLLCGFVIMAPTQVSQLDQIARRWTDVLWVGSERLHKVDDRKVNVVYYTILAVYCAWGLAALRVTPNPLVLAVASGMMWNFAYAFTALHLLCVMRTLMPKPLRPGMIECVGLFAGAVLYASISVIAFWQQWPAIKAWLAG